MLSGRAESRASVFPGTDRDLATAWCKTVEQVGVEVGCSGGTASYSAFYEMFPNAPVAFSGIGPGDAISANVYFNTSTRHWQLTLTDLTTGGHRGDQPERDTWHLDLERAVDHRQHHDGEQRR
jgi:hypothetical protein